MLEELKTNQVQALSFSDSKQLSQVQVVSYSDSSSIDINIKAVESIEA